MKKVICLLICLFFVGGMGCGNLSPTKSVIGESQLSVDSSSEKPKVALAKYEEEIPIINLGKVFKVACKTEKGFSCYVRDEILYTRFSWEKGNLDGCINRKVWHLGLRIQRSSTKVVLANLHIAVWKEGRTPVVAILATATDWTGSNKKAFCAKGSDLLRRANSEIDKLLLSVGMMSAAATMIADATAPIVTGPMATYAVTFTPTIIFTPPPTGTKL